SWSGELSRQLAEAIRRWLPGTLQYVKPYFTPIDIEKGAKWDNEISKELEASNFCIIALTRESLNSKWVMFEAGAIARTMDKAEVCPILFDLDPTDVEGPLQRFQGTRFSKAEIRQLLSSINSAASNVGLAERTLEAVFEKWWPDLEAEIASILKGARPVAKK